MPILARKWPLSATFAVIWYKVTTLRFRPPPQKVTNESLVPFSKEAGAVPPPQIKFSGVFYFVSGSLNAGLRGWYKIRVL